MPIPAIQDSLWPRLTTKIPPVPGGIKETPGDFLVEEIPAYEPCGAGEHLFVRIEKTGLTTRQAADQMARALKIRAMDIGLAGLKDAQAVAIQTVSVSGVEAAAAEQLQIPGLKVLSCAWHKNKLRMGHLRANRFRLKIRNVPPDRQADVRLILDELCRQGVPNYFGSQRFGMRQDTWKVGRALILKDPATAVRLIAGFPEEADSDRIREARTLFEEGRFSEAASLWPAGFRQCGQLCRAMARSGGNAGKALASMGSAWLWFFITAFQSYLFNHVLAARLETLGALFKGDLAYKHDSGAVFLVEEPEKEQPRANRFEISPSGPLYGFKMIEPAGEPAAVEKKVLEESGASAADFFRPGILKCPGARRPLRFKIEDLRIEAGKDEAGDYLELAFALPPGSYATAVLREIFKNSD